MPASQAQTCRVLLYDDGKTVSVSRHEALHRSLQLRAMATLDTEMQRRMLLAAFVWSTSCALLIVVLIICALVMNVHHESSADGWPWWAWFILVVQLFCLMAICGGFFSFLQLGGTTKAVGRSPELEFQQQPSATMMYRPMTQPMVPQPMATTTVRAPMASAQMPMASAQVPIQSTGASTAPIRAY